MMNAFLLLLHLLKMGLLTLYKRAVLNNHKLAFTCIMSMLHLVLTLCSYGH